MQRDSVASRGFLAWLPAAGWMATAHRSLLGVLVLAGLTACGGSNSSVKESAPVKPTSTLKAGGDTRAPESASSVQVPQAYQGVRSLLLARDAQDLPDKADLQKHANAVEALSWLGQHDDQLIVRARALNVLGFFDTPEVRSTLLELARSAQQPSKARAGAVEGLARLDPGSDAAVRSALVALMQDSDVRVGVAAVEALASVPAARQALEALSKESGLSKDVQRALERALK